MSEDRLADQINAGDQAQALLQNPTFREVLNNLDAAYHLAWREAKTVEAREDCHRYVTLIERLVNDITSMATSGKLARKRLDELSAKEKATWLKNLAA